MKLHILTLLMIILFVTGCQTSAGSTKDPQPDPSDKQPTTEDPHLPATETPKPEHETEDWRTFQPNEVGQIMILMYHEIGGQEGTWTRNVENFRHDLDVLYQENYRPVSLHDFVAGTIDVPAGTTPFVLTFDDGTSGHFRFLEEDGELVLDPDSAVAILLQMGEKYEDFTPAGTFYLYYPVPFRQRDLIAKKLQLLVQWGFEIGNHAYNHENLAQITREEATMALAKNVRSTQEYVPGYQVRSLALPYGARPKEDDHLTQGSWDGTDYKNNAILLVGANPAPSPFDTRFDPYSLPRIRADGTELPRWLDSFRKHPERRYVSDGDPDIITVPASLSEKINRIGQNNSDALIMSNANEYVRTEIDNTESKVREIAYNAVLEKEAIID
ncbi:MAG: polysaccharide deacetylase family protein, partial [Firmicutes bacterium]|nr:polysaccharide deacetylase family protein [Bacillota bacterium]